MSEAKPVLEWLKELPEPYRTAAISQYDPSFSKWIPCCLSNAIQIFCHLKDAKEGCLFWDAVHCAIVQDTAIPTYPEELLPKKENKMSDNTQQITILNFDGCEMCVTMQVSFTHIKELYGADRSWVEKTTLDDMKIEDIERLWVYRCGTEFPIDTVEMGISPKEYILKHIDENSIAELYLEEYFRQTL